MKYFALCVCMILLVYNDACAQQTDLESNYIGIMPAFLAEPYDTIKALEVNLFPFLYERRMGERNDVSLQFRPILNYRFFKDQSGFSQMGGTLAVNKYLLNFFADDFWLKPQIALFYTYAYNRLDQIQTMTLGIEPGAYMKVSEKFSLSMILQPGLNYYPDDFSKEFVDSESGFKSHFGVFFHFGYNF